jgi:hypothetical protein
MRPLHEQGGGRGKLRPRPCPSLTRGNGDTEVPSVTRPPDSYYFVLFANFCSNPSLPCHGWGSFLARIFVSLPCPRQRVASHDEVGRVAPRPLNKQATSFDPVRPKPVTEILVRHLLRFGDLEGFRLRQASVPIFTRSGKASSVTSRRSRSDTPYLATLNFIDPHPHVKVSQKATEETEVSVNHSSA